MRVLASATPLAGVRRVECHHAGSRVLVGNDQHVSDMGLLGHRAFHRHRHRHGVAVLGDLGKVELDLALHGVLPPVNFLIASSASFFARADCWMRRTPLWSSRAPSARAWRRLKFDVISAPQTRNLFKRLSQINVVAEAPMRRNVSPAYLSFVKAFRRRLWPRNIFTLAQVSSCGLALHRFCCPRNCVPWIVRQALSHSSGCILAWIGCDDCRA